MIYPFGDRRAAVHRKGRASFPTDESIDFVQEDAY